MDNENTTNIILDVIPKNRIFMDIEMNEHDKKVFSYLCYNILLYNMNILDNMSNIVKKHVTRKRIPTDDFNFLDDDKHIRYILTEDIKYVFQEYLFVTRNHCAIFLSLMDIGDGNGNKKGKDELSRMFKKDFQKFLTSIGLYDPKFPAYDTFRARRDYCRLTNTIIELTLLEKSTLGTVLDEPFLLIQDANNIINDVIKHNRTIAARKTEFNNIQERHKKLKEDFMRTFVNDLTSPNFSDVDKYTRHDVMLYMFLSYDQISFESRGKDTRVDFREDTEFRINIPTILYKYQVYIYCIKSFLNNYDMLIHDRIESEKNKIILNDDGREKNHKERLYPEINKDTTDKEMIEFLFKLNTERYCNYNKEQLEDKGVFDAEFFYNINIDEKIELPVYPHMKIYGRYVCLDHAYNTPKQIQSGTTLNTLKSIVYDKYIMPKGRKYFDKDWCPEQFIVIYKLMKLLGILDQVKDYLKN